MGRFYISLFLADKQTTMEFQNTREFAQQLDAKDKLAKYRDEFLFPHVNGKQVIYFTGNSLGLQPKRTKAYVDEVMDDWAKLAVEGHFYADKPWWDYHERFAAPLAKIVGALPTEVTVMNTLSVNLHLLMVTFYRPTPKKLRSFAKRRLSRATSICCAARCAFMVTSHLKLLWK